IKSFAPGRTRSNRARRGIGALQRRAPSPPVAPHGHVGAAVGPSNEFQLSLVERPLRRAALRRASRVRAMLAGADFAAALVTLVALDLVYPDAALITPATLVLVPAVLLLA